MYKFDGIQPEGIWLLQQNRFENSKEFYEEHKDDIKNLVMNPAKQLASIIGEDMYKYDSFMELEPNKMVSRIRRDTRFSKDKSLYRENVWIMFMRNKKIDTFVPCFWFEIFPHCYVCGVTGFDSNARILEIYRQKITENPVAFQKAVKSCLNVGYVSAGQKYKKIKDGTLNLPEGIREYYNMKNVSFRRIFSNVNDLKDKAFIDELKKTYKQMNAYYQFLLEVYDTYKLERGAFSYEQRKTQEVNIK